MSLEWFLRWLEERRRLPVRHLLRDAFEEVVFAQHIKVALSRFDGELQRLRFLLGDSGITPTRSAAAQMGVAPTRTADRLPALLHLLVDTDVLRSDETGTLSVGNHGGLLTAADS